MMHSNFRIGLTGIALFGALGAYGAALAQSPPIATSPSTATTPSTMSAVQGATTGLGDSHRFTSSAAASAHCSSDTIIWSSGPSLTYSLPGATGYGKGQGFYACKGEADDAGFRPGS